MSVFEVLAQGTRSSGAVGEILPLVGVGLVIALIGGAVAVRLRRKAIEGGRADEAGTMEQIRAMAARGEISGAEFEAIRRTMAHAAARRMDLKRAAAEESKAARDPSGLGMLADMLGDGRLGDGRLGDGRGGLAGGATTGKSSGGGRKKDEGSPVARAGRPPASGTGSRADKPVDTGERRAAPGFDLLGRRLPPERGDAGEQREKTVE